MTGLRASSQARAIWPGVAPWARPTWSSVPPGAVSWPADSGNQGDEADGLLLAVVQHRLASPVGQVVAVLDRRDREHALGRLDLGDAYLAQAGVPDDLGVEQRLDGVELLAGRHARIDPVQLPQINRLDAQALAACLGLGHQIVRVTLRDPLAGVDPISTAKLEETIAELKADYTIVIVTHNLSQAARISDYTGFMYLGKMVEFGPTDEIFMRPKVTRTQDYVCGRFG